jgi:hypothetical protein
MASELLAAALPDAPQPDEMGMPSLLQGVCCCPGADKTTTTAASGDRQEGGNGSDGGALLPLPRRAGAACTTTIALCLPACAAAVESYDTIYIHSYCFTYKNLSLTLKCIQTTRSTLSSSLHPLRL